MLIPRVVLKNIQCIERETTRYALHCIELKRVTGDWLIANTCDGKRLLSVRWREPDRGSITAFFPGYTTFGGDFVKLVHAETVKKFASSASIPLRKGVPCTQWAWLDESATPHKLWLSDSQQHLSMDLPAVETAYPRLADVWPKFQHPKSVVFDTRLMKGVFDAVNSIRGSGDNAIPAGRLTVESTPDREECPGEARLPMAIRVSCHNYDVQADIEVASLLVPVECVGHDFDLAEPPTREQILKTMRQE